MRLKKLTDFQDSDKLEISKVCGYSSVVERHLAKVNVARSNRVTRLSKISSEKI